MRIVLGATIVILLISQYVTNGLVGIVTAFSSVQESHLLPFTQSSIQNSDIHYVSLANLTTSLLPDIFKRVENSVVQITSRVNDTSNLQIIINGNPLQGQSTRLGSGFVYDNQGHIVTNSHVVGGAVEMDVTFPAGNKYTANVIANHDQPQSSTCSYVANIAL